MEKIDGTFRSNRKINMHRWYPYVEGFSESFVEDILSRNKTENDHLIYDPFNGSGTTTLTCSYNGINAIGSEINPLMQFISKTKVNTSINVVKNKKLSKFKDIIDEFINIDKSEIQFIDINKYINSCYLDKEYFSDKALKEFAYIKKYILSQDDEDIIDLLQLSLASIVVSCSNMIRSTDLRKRKNKEIDNIKNVIEMFELKNMQIYNDLESEKETIKQMKYIEIIDNDAKYLNEKYSNKVDLIITSPPYINGTNYFRNTKLELWILDYISHEDDLKYYRGRALTAGINNVSNRIDSIKEFDFVKELVDDFDSISADRKIDKRIPKMIEAYFSDMDKVFLNMNNVLKNEGRIYFDIGDSQYYGIYVPVYDFIIKIAKYNKLKLVDRYKIRDRRSNSGLPLTQEVLVFQKIGE